MKNIENVKNHVSCFLLILSLVRMRKIKKDTLKNAYRLKLIQKVFGAFSTALPSAPPHLPTSVNDLPFLHVLPSYGNTPFYGNTRGKGRSFTEVGRCGGTEDRTVKNALKTL